MGNPPDLFCYTLQHLVSICRTAFYVLLLHRDHMLSHFLPAPGFLLLTIFLKPLLVFIALVSRPIVALI